jgi:hypothetical protein
VNVAVPVSALLFEAVQLAVAIARETAAPSIPTVGGRMHDAVSIATIRSGRTSNSRGPGERTAPAFATSSLDAPARTITLTRPLVLDLARWRKGLAIDMAAVRIAAVRDFAVDAGGTSSRWSPARTANRGRSASGIRAARAS